jgi:hypothetical protein
VRPDPPLLSTLFLSHCQMGSLEKIKRSNTFLCHSSLFFDNKRNEKGERWNWSTKPIIFQIPILQTRDRRDLSLISSRKENFEENCQSWEIQKMAELKKE